MTHQHEYFGGVCLCGKRQPIYKNGKEVGLSDLSGVKIAPTPNISKKKGATSQFQYTTQLLLDCLGVSTKEFPKYCGFVKKLGVGNIHGIIKEVESADRWCLSTHHQKLNRIGFFLNRWVSKKNEKTKL